MKQIKNPLEAKIDRSNGNIEISIAKKYSDSEAPVFEKFMGMCGMYDAYAVNTAEEDDKGTEKACSMTYAKEIQAIYKKVEANLFAPQPQHMLAGLSDEQKKSLPVELQKAIVKKLKAEGKITKEMDANLFAPQGQGIANLFAPQGRPGMM